jgi:hypothetical protein
VSTRVASEVGADAPRQWHGVYLARVVNSRVPDRWLQLQIPQVLGTSVSNWAAPMAAADGTGPGASTGTIVLAMFVGGDVNTPVWMTTSQRLR